MSVVEVAVVAVAVEVTEALDYNVCSSDCHTRTKVLIKSMETVVCGFLLTISLQCDTLIK